MSAINLTKGGFLRRVMDYEKNPISDWRFLGNKPAIIDFYASWCGPCRAANPHLRELYKKYKSEGLEIVGVSFDVKREAWTKAIKDDQIEWIQMSDLKGWNSIASDLYDVHGIPCIYILDEENRIIGARVWGEEVDEILTKVFR